MNTILDRIESAHVIHVLEKSCDSSQAFNTQDQEVLAKLELDIGNRAIQYYAPLQQIILELHYAETNSSDYGSASYRCMRWLLMLRIRADDADVTSAYIKALKTIYDKL